VAVIKRIKTQFDDKIVSTLELNEKEVLKKLIKKNPRMPEYIVRAKSFINIFSFVALLAIINSYSWTNEIETT
jgi:hypothetical protein